jgi:hypothetical protein
MLCYVLKIFIVTILEIHKRYYLLYLSFVRIDEKDVTY